MIKYYDHMPELLLSLKTNKNNVEKNNKNLINKFLFFKSSVKHIDNLSYVAKNNLKNSF